MLKTRAHALQTSAKVVGALFRDQPGVNVYMAALVDLDIPRARIGDRLGKWLASPAPLFIAHHSPFLMLDHSVRVWLASIGGKPVLG